MSKIWLIVLLALAILAAPSVAVKFTSGGSSSDTSDGTTSSIATDDSSTTNWENLDANALSSGVAEDAAKKLFNGTKFPISDSTLKRVPIVTLTIQGLVNNGQVTEDGWLAIKNAFESQSSMYENDQDRAEYLQENQDFADGVPSALPMHMKQCIRFAEFAGDYISLSGDAKLGVLPGTIRWQGAKGTLYNVPGIGLTSRKDSETGKILYPDLEGEGFKDDIVQVPYTPSSLDSFSWYFVTRQ